MANGQSLTNLNMTHPMNSKIAIPVDPDTEGLVLLSIINSINAANELIPLLKADDFYERHNLEIYLLCKELYNEGKSINLDTLCVKAKEQGSLKNIIRDKDSLLTFIYAFPVGYDHKAAFDKLREVTNKRALIAKSYQILKNISETSTENVTKDLQDFIIELQGSKKSKQRKWSDIVTNFENNQTQSAVTEERLRRKNAGLSPFDGVASGFKQLDETLGFFRKGKLYYIGARTSMGKTTFIANLMINMLQAGKKISFFSLEQGWNSISEKLVGIITNIHSNRLLEGKITLEELERVKELEKIVDKYELWIDEESALTASQIAARIQRNVYNLGVEIVFIDYLTLIKASGNFNNKHLEVGEVSKTLQHIAKHLNIPVVCLCQLNRSVTNRTNPRPTIADFRESGSIEEDADACIMLHRPEYYDKATKPGVMEVIVVKNRIMSKHATIEFSCNTKYAERIEELPSVEDAIKQAKEDEAHERFLKHWSNND